MKKQRLKVELECKILNLNVYYLANKKHLNESELNRTYRKELDNLVSEYKQKGLPESKITDTIKFSNHYIPYKIEKPSLLERIVKPFYDMIERMDF